MNVLELQGADGFRCSGSVQVNDYFYRKTQVGDELNALRDGTRCYLRVDRRWQDGYRMQIMMNGAAGLVFALIESWLVFRFFRD